MKPVTLDHVDLRRAVRFSPSYGYQDLAVLRSWLDVWSPSATEDAVRAAHHAPWDAGDILWAREHTALDGGKVLYSGDHDLAPSRLPWRSPSKMPFKLARIFLRVTGVRLRQEQGVPGWFWEADVEVLRDRKGKLCRPGSDAVWRPGFHAALVYNEIRAQETALATLTPMVAAEEWERLREHLLTLASAWIQEGYGLGMTRAVMQLVRPHKARVGDAWDALVERERLEKLP